AHIPVNIVHLLEAQFQSWFSGNFNPLLFVFGLVGVILFTAEVSRSKESTINKQYLIAVGLPYVAWLVVLLAFHDGIASWALSARLYVHFALIMSLGSLWFGVRLMPTRGRELFIGALVLAIVFLPNVGNSLINQRRTTRVYRLVNKILKQHDSPGSELIITRTPKIYIASGYNAVSFSYARKNHFKLQERKFANNYQKIFLLQYLENEKVVDSDREPKTFRLKTIFEQQYGKLKGDRSRSIRVSELM
ncbi:MAG: hypothetical protein KDD62_00410, partial [Bdellovibrionales bacterium]|nr:hypothetical protein [Bdellovibrionales bacterium]